MREEIPGIEPTLLDWLLPLRSEYKGKNQKIGLIEADFSLFFGEILDNKIFGRGIRIQNNGNIFIGYFNAGKVVGHFVEIEWDGEL